MTRVILLAIAFLVPTILSGSHAVAGFSTPATASAAEVIVESVEGSVVIFLSEFEGNGVEITPRTGDVLTPPLIILTSSDSRIDIRVEGYQLSVAPESSVVIPGATAGRDGRII